MALANGYTDFALTRKIGDTIYLDITIARSGANIPIANIQEVWFTGKKSLSDTDAQAVFQKKLSAGSIVLTGTIATETQGYVKILPTDTDTLTKETTLYCDLQILETSGDLTTVQAGTLTLQMQTTIAEV